MGPTFTLALQNVQKNEGGKLAWETFLKNKFDKCVKFWLCKETSTRLAKSVNKFKLDCRFNYSSGNDSCLFNVFDLPDMFLN